MTTDIISTECCNVQIHSDQRYCPKCGYEARIHTRKTEGDKQMNWIPMSKQMPPDTDEEIFIRKLDCTEWHHTPANEIWMDVSKDNAHEWEWAYWKTIKHEIQSREKPL